MAIRNVIKEGDGKLRKTSRKVEFFDQKLHDLLDDLKETMIKEDGVGLAAPQVGILRRVFVIDIGEGVMEFVNPIIEASEGSQRDIEGCLSVVLDKGYVTRPYKVTISAFDRYGNQFTKTFEELGARAICHENDHLDGILFVDKAEKRLSQEELKKIYGKNE